MPEKPYAAAWDTAERRTIPLAHRSCATPPKYQVLRQLASDFDYRNRSCGICHEPLVKRVAASPKLFTLQPGPLSPQPPARAEGRKEIGVIYVLSANRALEPLWHYSCLPRLLPAGALVCGIGPDVNLDGDCPGCRKPLQPRGDRIARIISGGRSLQAYARCVPRGTTIVSVSKLRYWDVRCEVHGATDCWQRA